MLEKVALIVEIVTFSLICLFIIIEIIRDLVNSYRNKKSDDVMNSFLSCVTECIANSENKNNTKTTRGRKPKQNKSEESTSYEKCNIGKLRQIAKDKGIPKYYILKKNELIQKLKETE